MPSVEYILDPVQTRSISCHWLACLVTAECHRSLFKAHTPLVVVPFLCLRLHVFTVCCNFVRLPDKSTVLFGASWIDIRLRFRGRTPLTTFAAVFILACYWIYILLNPSIRLALTGVMVTSSTPSPAPSVRFASFLPRSHSAAAMSAASNVSDPEQQSTSDQYAASETGSVPQNNNHIYDDTFRYRTVSLPPQCLDNPVSNPPLDDQLPSQTNRRIWMDAL